MEPMFNFNGGARADLMAAVEELERHNEQESQAVLSLFHICQNVRGSSAASALLPLSAIQKITQPGNHTHEPHCLVEPPLR